MDPCVQELFFAEILGDVQKATTAIKELRDLAPRVAADFHSATADTIERLNMQTGALAAEADRIATEIENIRCNTATASIEDITRSLAMSTCSAANRIAVNLVQRDKVRWLAVSIIASCLAIGGIAGGAFWIGQATGMKQGLADGYGRAHDEKAAANWAATPQGKLAYAFAQAGSLEALARCDNPGWVRKDGNCFVHAIADGSTYGFKVP